jgi:hypothetical protein
VSTRRSVACALASLLLPQCASDVDATLPPPMPTPESVCQNLASICPEDPTSCRDALRFIWDVAPSFGVDIECLGATRSVTEARDCGYPCGGNVT